MSLYKNIHIGSLIKQLVTENGIEMSRICNFLHCTENEVLDTYTSKDIDTSALLKWSKLLEYDFFRIYTQHLILYAPFSNHYLKENENKTEGLPSFRKNIYTREIIDYVLKKIRTGEMSKSEVLKKYDIPKTTLHKWIEKYDIQKEE
ncbi:helix-turn-helix domain-containing protein [Empedobacter falsenii]|uniref:Transposase n=1 Tax=Empedobacter falsenii TaxID=343874 RepID=A0AAW7DHQ8_9FLAO|nr:helix-turn-helix domain-containing protein [Empedobacter falsenii]MDM1551516.1 transposase [Empedobacter falsenii]